MAESKTTEPAEVVEAPPPPPPSVTEHERELAHAAGQEFEKGQFEACLNALKKLSAVRPHDPRVYHNKAVVEYYASGLKKTDEFRHAMIDVCSKAQVNVDSLTSLDDVDQCVIYYNQAVLLYHLKQYTSAIAIIDKLFQFIEPMEESLSRQVMFLLIELYLLTHQPEKAMGMVGFLEKMLFGNGKSPQQTTQEKDKDGNKEKESWESPWESTQNDAFRPRISQYKARCCIMLKSMKSCKREIKGLMNSLGVTTPVIYLKSNFEYLRGNFRKAIKVLNTAPTAKPMSETGENVAMMYYNNLGVVHLQMRKHHLAAFYFRKATQENENGALFNKGDAGRGLSGRPVQTLMLSRHYELLYNMGIVQLHCGKPLVAFDCLTEVVQIYQTNPRLWLRLAECCIMAYKGNNEDDCKMEQRMEVIQGTVGHGVHRKLLFGKGLSHKRTSAESAAMPAPTLEFAALCLRNALILLPEDPATVAAAPNGDQQTDAKPTVESVLVPAPPGNPLRSVEVANIRCSVLASSAYVALCLDDYLVALHYAEQLLKQTRLSGAHRYLAHLYMGEALVELDRIADAIQHMNSDLVTDVSTIPPEHKQDQDKGDRNGDRDGQETTDAKGALYPWYPKDLSRAKAIVQYNLATAHAVRGEYEKAMLQLEKSMQGMGPLLPAQMYFLQLYLLLMEGYEEKKTPTGHRKNTQQIIKEHFGHVAPNRV